jgi:outer membrane lipoprotein-sorting protein
MLIKRFFKLEYLFVLFVFLFALADLTWANELTGTQIMEKVCERENGNDSSAKITFNINYSEGKGRIRNTKWLWIDMDGKGGFSEKAMFFFLSPPDIKDTAFLSWNYEKYDKDDDQWVYLPALRKIRRIASSSKRDSFFGTEFSYADLNTREIDEDTHTFLRKELFQDIECYVVESIPKDKKDAYSKIVSWIDPERWIILKAEYYNRKGEHLKTQLLKWELIHDIWTATNLVMENHLNGNKTIVTTKDVQYNTGLKEKLFYERTLKRGVR